MVSMFKHIIAELLSLAFVLLGCILWFLVSLMVCVAYTKFLKRIFKSVKKRQKNTENILLGGGGGSAL